MMSAILDMCEGATEIVQRPISANPGLNFYPGMFFFSSKVFSLAIFSSNFLYSCKSGQSSNCRQKRIQLNLLSKLLYLISNFALTLGYLNPTLNNPAQSIACILITTLQYTCCTQTDNHYTTTAY